MTALALLLCLVAAPTLAERSVERGTCRAHWRVDPAELPLSGSVQLRLVVTGPGITAVECASPFRIPGWRLADPPRGDVPRESPESDRWIQQWRLFPLAAGEQPLALPTVQVWQRASEKPIELLADPLFLFVSTRLARVDWELARPVVGWDPSETVPHPDTTWFWWMIFAGIVILAAGAAWIWRRRQKQRGGLTFANSLAEMRLRLEGLRQPDRAHCDALFELLREALALQCLVPTAHWTAADVARHFRAAGRTSENVRRGVDALAEIDRARFGDGECSRRAWDAAWEFVFDILDENRYFAIDNESAKNEQIA